MNKIDKITKILVYFVVTIAFFMFIVHIFVI